MADINKNFMGVAIIAFIAVILGISFLSSTADDTARITAPTSQTNESFTGSNSSQVNITYANLVTTVVRTSTGITMTENANYTVNTTSGAIQLVNLSAGTYYTDYTYYHNDYVSDSSTRTVTGVIVIMFALGVLAILIAYVYPRIREISGK